MKKNQHHFLAAILFISTLTFAKANNGIPQNCGAPSKTEMACSISNFVMTSAECDGELRVFNFTFTGTDFGLNGYTVQSPDGSQMYTLGDPQVYSMIALCTESIIFTIFDNNNPACKATFSYGLVCCPCLVDISVNQEACNNGSLSAAIRLLETGGSCANYHPILFINNIQYAMVYDRSTGLFRVNNISSTDRFLTYRICTGVPNLNECFEYVFENPCYQVIANFKATLNPASCSNGLMTVPFSFIGADFGLQGFTIYTSIGTTHPFTVDDVYELKLPAYCDDIVVLTIVDNVTLDYAEFVLGRVCCPCKPKLDVRTTKCVADTFSLNIVFENEAAKCGIDKWTLKVNGLTTILFPTDSGYISSQILGTDSLVIYKFCPLADTLHCIKDTLVNPCFDTLSHLCKILSFVASTDVASCSGETIDVSFGYNASGFGSNGFTISTNSGYTKTFTSSDTFLLTVPARCDKDLIFIITDAIDSLCTATDTLGSLCCPCVPSLVVSASTCAGDSFNLNFLIDSISGSCINYDWSLSVNGEAFNLNQTNTGYTSSGIRSTDSLIIYSLCTLVPGLPECFSDTLVNPCFDTILSDTCHISRFKVTADMNSCSGEIIELRFNYQATAFAAKGYTVTSNTGFSQSFSLTDSTGITLLADCDKNIFFRITDSDDALCTAVDTVGPLCCPCEPSFFVNAGTCAEGNFNLNILVDSISGSCINYNWQLTVNGEFYDLQPSNTGYTSSNIQSADSMLIYELCALVPGLSECFTMTMLNPCYEIINPVREPQVLDQINITLVHGQQINLDNRYDQLLSVFVYNINGQQMPFAPILGPLQSATYDITSWPAGLYIVKISSSQFTSSVKLLNIK